MSDKLIKISRDLVGVRRSHLKVQNIRKSFTEKSEMTTLIKCPMFFPRPSYICGCVDYGDEEGIQHTSEKVSSISTGSTRNADIKISILKTNTMHVRHHDTITKTTTSEALTQCKFTCPHAHCDQKFKTQTGLDIQCQCRNEFEIKQILNHYQGSVHK